MLHVTNGDGAGDKLRRAGLAGEIVAWKDVLHEGPVPGDASLEEMREIRAGFIAGQGWGSYEEVLTDFQRRGPALARFAE